MTCKNIFVSFGLCENYLFLYEKLPDEKSKLQYTWKCKMFHWLQFTDRYTTADRSPLTCKCLNQKGQELELPESTSSTTLLYYFQFKIDVQYTPFQHDDM